MNWKRLPADERRKQRQAGDLRRFTDPAYVAAEQARRFAAGNLNPGDPLTDSRSLTVNGVTYSLPPIGSPLFVRNTGFVAWAIATGTRSAFNHVGMYMGWVPVNGKPVPTVLEARPTGAILTPLSDFIISKEVRRAEWGDVPEFADQARRNVAPGASGAETATEENRLRVAAARVGMGMLRTPYGWAGVVAIGFLQFGIHTSWVNRKVRAMDNAFCSQLYSWSVLAAGVTLNRVGIADDSHGRRVAPNVWGVSPGDLARGRTLTPISPQA